MSSQPDPPLPNSYWVLPGRLAGGEYPGGLDDAETDERLATLAAAGIDCFINLTRPGELPPYHPRLGAAAQHFNLPIPDHGVPDRSGMVQILTVIAGALQSGRRIYVHCRAGIGRTGTVLGCILVERGLDGEGALTRLNEHWRQCARARRWPSVPETLAQTEFVRLWEGGTLAPALAGLEHAPSSAQPAGTEEVP